MPKFIDKRIQELENNLSKLKFVQSYFPETKVYEDNYVANKFFFCSKLVNSQYTHFNFEDKYSTLYVCPYVELEFENNGIEIIKVHSSPIRNRLVYLSYDFKNKKNVMKFSRFQFNLKNNNFKEDVFNSCRSKIVDFIKKYPQYTLDTKYLDDRLKNLISFI